MRRYIRAFFIAFALTFVALVLGLADWAHAADGDTLLVPRLSLQRVSISIGADHAFLPDAAGSEVDVWRAYAGIGYQIGTVLSAVAAARLPFAEDGVDFGQQPEYTVGVRVLLMGNGKWRLW